MRKALIVGGANGIGLSIATQLSNREDCERVYIVDKVLIAEQYLNQKFESIQFDLITEDYSIFDSFKDVDTLMITAGFGKPSLFKDIAEQHITSSFSVNAMAPIRIIHHFMDKLVGKEDFRCGVMVSIAGFMSSPFFAVYGATKAALKIFIESLNVELEKGGSTNRILNVSPGFLSGARVSIMGRQTFLLQKHWQTRLLNISKQRMIYSSLSMRKSSSKCSHAIKLTLEKREDTVMNIN